MGIYFSFSDECGDYKPNMSEKTKTTHPFYIRSCFTINAQEWKFLKIEFDKLKLAYGLALNKEIKWSYLWQLRHIQKSKKVLEENHELKFLENYEYHKLIDFVEDCLALIPKLKHKDVVLTYTRNANSYNINEKSMLCFHLQEHMQRLEMGMNGNNDNLAVLFFDPISQEKNELFREIYNELYENGDFIENYSFIKDSLNIENSHHSVGIQIADFISGAFSALLRSTPGQDFSRGVKMFNLYVKPYLRRGYSDELHGFDIREVPRNQPTRRWLTLQLNKYSGDK